MTLLGDRIAAARKAAKTRKAMKAARKAPLQPKPGFDWGRVTWGWPDSAPSVLCSYCSASIPDDAIPLMVWKGDGHAARFCDQCQKEWWGTAH